MAKRTYRYSATVNDTRRSVIFSADPEEWGHESYPDDPAEFNLSTAELYVDNEFDTYSAFYKGATDADYDAERENAVLEVYGWTIVEAD